MKEKIQKNDREESRNYFCSHMSAQVTVTVVLLLILVRSGPSDLRKNQYLIICSGYQINGRIHD